jgi:hypothetical protein
MLARRVNEEKKERKKERKKESNRPGTIEDNANANY